MARKWQPGDVAMVLCSDDEWRRAFSVLYLGKLAWFFDNGALRDVDISEAIPLVVIDAEDPAEVIRLADLFERTLCARPVVDRMRDSLRQFANPTPPLCQHSLSIDTSQSVDNYCCDKPEGHDGAHMDEARGMAWTARDE